MRRLSRSTVRDNVNLEVRKSCSRALKAFARILLKDKTRKMSREDSFKAEVGFPILEYQWQLGSLYFPQQPVKASSIETNLDMGREAYALMLEAFDKYAPGVSSKSFLPYSSQHITSELAVGDIDKLAVNRPRNPCQMVDVGQGQRSAVQSIGDCKCELVAVARRSQCPPEAWNRCGKVDEELLTLGLCAVSGEVAVTRCGDRSKQDAPPIKGGIFYQAHIRSILLRNLHQTVVQVGEPEED